MQTGVVGAGAGAEPHVEATRRLGNKNKIKVNCSRPAIVYVIILQIALDGGGEQGERWGEDKF